MTSKTESAELQMLRETVSDLRATVSELRLFNGRLMTGYESAHRRVAEHSDTLAVQNAELNRIAATSLEMRVKLVGEHEEMLSRRTERDIASTLAKQKAEAWGAMARDARVVGTLAVKRLAGIPLTGNDSHGLQDLLNTMTPDQIEDVIVKGELKLTEGQRAMLAGTLTSLDASEKAQAAE